jgi:predicted component of viral defense system (DUF524 family)
MEVQISIEELTILIEEYGYTIEELVFQDQLGDLRIFCSKSKTLTTFKGYRRFHISQKKSLIIISKSQNDCIRSVD